MTDFCNSFSLFLTPFVFAACSLVVLLYGTTAIKMRSPASSSDWLVLGITIGFAGKFADNIYWSLAWTAYRQGNAKWWLEHGQCFNIWFRQLATIAAAYCHIQALHAGKARITRRELIGCLLLGVVLYGFVTCSIVYG